MERYPQEDKRAALVVFQVFFAVISAWVFFWGGYTLLWPGAGDTFSTYSALASYVQQTMIPSMVLWSLGLTYLGVALGLLKRSPESAYFLNFISFFALLLGALLWLSIGNLDTCLTGFCRGFGGWYLYIPLGTGFLATVSCIVSTGYGVKIPLQSPQPLSGAIPSQTRAGILLQRPPRKRYRILWKGSAVMVVVLIVAVIAISDPWAVAPPELICGPVPATIGLAEDGSGTKNSGLPTAWGTGQPCTAASTCQTDNFSMSASSGITTGLFGFRIISSGGSTVIGWVIVLWNAPGTTPLAAWSQSNGTWTAASGQTLPIGELQDDGVMLITSPSTTLIGSGDTLSAFATDSRCVSGQTTL